MDLAHEVISKVPSTNSETALAQLTGDLINTIEAGANGRHVVSPQVYNVARS